MHTPKFSEERAAFVTAIDVGRKAAKSGNLHDNAVAQSILDRFGKPDDQADRLLLSK